MACGTVLSALTRTLQRHSNVPCVMSAKELPRGKQMFLFCVCIFKVSDYSLCITTSALIADECNH